MDNENTPTITERSNKVLEEGTREGIFGSIKGREIDHIEYDRWQGGARGPEKLLLRTAAR